MSASGSAELDIPTPPLPRLEARTGVFSRVVTAPSGAPWEQARIAELDARLGAPMPVSTLAIRLVRLTPWRPGVEARFVVFYARVEAVRGGLTVERRIEGRALKIAFHSPADQARRLRLAAAAAAVGLLCAGLVAGAVVKTLASWASLQPQLGHDVRIAAGAIRQSQANSRQTQTNLQVRAAGLEGRTAADMVAAMAAAGARRKPDASIAAFHWDHGYVALETAGSSPPVEGLATPGRQTKSGGWLWGLGDMTGGRGPAK
ncbi:MAG: hypothetical protein JWM33_1271 [Caulobacteraceae bacterium]|nr:hypothetical protein [Caulobacteraceae bacterium]